MKLVVAYVEPDRFEPIRESLVALGFPSLSALNSAGTSPDSTVTRTYRGTELTQHSRAKSRLECVVGDEHAETVVATIVENGDERTFAYVLDVVSAYPVDSVKADEAAAVH